MSDVQRYKFNESTGAMVGDQNGDWCYASTAQSQLAALREELATARRGLTAMALLDNEILAKLKDSLAGAERRNSELTELLRLASGDYAYCLGAGYDRITEAGGDCDSVENMLADNPNYARYTAALNPNPEAASHDE